MGNVRDGRRWRRCGNATTGARSSASPSYPHRLRQDKSRHHTIAKEIGDGGGEVDCFIGRECAHGGGLERRTLAECLAKGEYGNIERPIDHFVATPVDCETDSARVEIDDFV